MSVLGFHTRRRRFSSSCALVVFILDRRILEFVFLRTCCFAVLANNFPDCIFFEFAPTVVSYCTEVNGALTKKFDIFGEVPDHACP